MLATAYHPPEERLCRDVEDRPLTLSVRTRFDSDADELRVLKRHIGKLHFEDRCLPWADASAFSAIKPRLHPDELEGVTEAVRQRGADRRGPAKLWMDVVAPDALITRP